MRNHLPTALLILFFTSASAQVNLPCITNFTLSSTSYTIDTVCLGLPVQFTDSSASPGGAMSFFVWDFGDNSGSSFEANPSHIYTTVGSDTITLNASDGAGCSGQKIRYLTVIGPPTVNFYTPTLPDCVGDCNGSMEVDFAGPLLLNQYTVVWNDQNGPIGQTGWGADSLCAGSYEAKVIDQYGCVDAEVTGAMLDDPTPVVATIDAGSILMGCDLDTLSISGTGSGGTSPYAYQWSQADSGNDFSGNATQFTSYFLTGTNAQQITLNVTDVHGCAAPAVSADITLSPSELNGTVTIGGVPCANCPIAFYKWESFGIWVDLGGAATTDASGNYSLIVPAYQDYIVRIAPNSVQHPLTCPTYSGNTHDFTIAQQINSNCGAVVTTDVAVITMPVLNGGCTLTGTVNSYQPWPGKVAEEDPIPLIDVVVEKVPPGGSFIMNHDITDATGTYSFDLMPETGGAEYVVHVDIAGVPQVQTYSITVNPGDVLYADLDFCITNDSAVFTNLEIITCNVDGIEHITTASSTFAIQVGPNPCAGPLQVNLSGMKGNEPVFISLVDGLGRTVLTTTTNRSSSTIDTSALAPGIYTVRAEQNGAVAASKLIISK